MANVKISDLTEGTLDGDTSLFLVSNFVNNEYSSFNTTPKKIVKAGVVELIGTLEAGETTITFQDASIMADSNLRPFVNVFGVAPKNMQSVAGVVTLTFDAMNFDLGVKVVVF